MNFEDKIRSSMYETGFYYPPTVFKYDEWENFSYGQAGKKENNCTYKIYSNHGNPFCMYRHYSTSEFIKVYSDSYTSLTGEEKRAIDTLIKNEIEKKKKEDEEEHRRVAMECVERYNSLKPASDGNPYLKKKGVKAYRTLREEGNRLVVPYFDENAMISTLQYIDETGEKRLTKGGKIGGCFLPLLSDTNINLFEASVYLCEGVATGLSIYEATGKTTIVCGNAGNLLPVSKLFPRGVVIADYDSDSKAGEIGAKKTGLDYVLMQDPDNPSISCDANDYAKLHGLKALKEFIEKKEDNPLMKYYDNSINATAKKDWLIKYWLSKGDLVALYAPPKHGKSFIAIGWALSIASGQADCGGYKIPGRKKVLYLAGEGVEGFRRRMWGWCKYYNINPVDLNGYFVLAETPFKIDDDNDLEKLFNYLQKAFETGKYKNFKPDLIVLDTLNRYMIGDENSTKDSNKMIAGLDRLKSKLNCCVLYVHHTPKSNSEEQRGSSVFLGSNDFADTIAKNEYDLTIKQVAVRDQEEKEMYCHLEKVELGTDEEGEAIDTLVAVFKKTPTITTKKEEEDTRIDDINISYRELIDFFPWKRLLNPIPRKEVYSYYENKLIEEGTPKEKVKNKINNLLRIMKGKNTTGLFQQFYNRKWVEIKEVEGEKCFFLNVSEYDFAYMFTRKHREDEEKKKKELEEQQAKEEQEELEQELGEQPEEKDQQLELQLEEEQPDEQD